MVGRTVTLTVPDPLYDRLQQRAAQTRRSVQEEMLDALALAVPLDDFPADLAARLAELAALDDAALWTVARSHLPAATAARLARLNRKRQREGLTEVEAHEASSLLERYDQMLLVRAEAARLLKGRGHDIAEFVGGA